MIRFQVMHRIAKLRRCFSLNQEFVLRLADTFGSQYFDQQVHVSVAHFNKLNASNLETFEKGLSEFIEREVKGKKLTIDEVQAFGSGQQIPIIRDVTMKLLEDETSSSTLVPRNSVLHGLACFHQFSKDMETFLPYDIFYDIIVANPQLPSPESNSDQHDDKQLANCSEDKGYDATQRN